MQSPKKTNFSYDTTPLGKNSPKIFIDGYKFERDIFKLKKLLFSLEEEIQVYIN